MPDESQREEGIHASASLDLPPPQDLRLPVIHVVSIADGSREGLPAGNTALLEVSPLTGDARYGPTSTSTVQNNLLDTLESVKNS